MKIIQRNESKEKDKSQKVYKPKKIDHLNLGLPMGLSIERTEKPVKNDIYNLYNIYSTLENPQIISVIKDFDGKIESDRASLIKHILFNEQYRFKVMPDSFIYENIPEISVLTSKSLINSLLEKQEILNKLKNIVKTDENYQLNDNIKNKLKSILVEEQNYYKGKLKEDTLEDHCNNKLKLYDTFKLLLTMHVKDDIYKIAVNQYMYNMVINEDIPDLLNRISRLYLNNKKLVHLNDKKELVGIKSNNMVYKIHYIYDKDKEFDAYITIPTLIIDNKYILPLVFSRKESYNRKLLSDICDSYSYFTSVLYNTINTYVFYKRNLNDKFNLLNTLIINAPKDGHISIFKVFNDSFNIGIKHPIYGKTIPSIKQYFDYFSIYSKNEIFNASYKQLVNGYEQI